MPSEQELKDRVDEAIDWVADRSGPADQANQRVMHIFPSFPIAMHFPNYSNLCLKVRALGNRTSAITGRSAPTRQETAFKSGFGFLLQKGVQVQEFFNKSNPGPLEMSDYAQSKRISLSFDGEKHLVEFYSDRGPIAYRFEVTRKYYDNKTVDYTVKLVERPIAMYPGPAEVWVGDEKIISDANTLSIGGSGILSARQHKNGGAYFFRTMALPGANLLEASSSVPQQDMADELNDFTARFWEDLGYGWTTPIFGKRTDLPDLYMYDADKMWADSEDDYGCPGTFPVGEPTTSGAGEFHGYSTWSKVMYFRPTWSAMTTVDPLYLQPTAVHLLNKYGDPYREVHWPTRGFWGRLKEIDPMGTYLETALFYYSARLSPVRVAEYIRDVFWKDELGVRMFVPMRLGLPPLVPFVAWLNVFPEVHLRRTWPFLQTHWSRPVFAFGGDVEAGNSLRTNGFLVLSTLLGYKYGIQEWKDFADKAADILVKTAWGMTPYYDQHVGHSDEHGTLKLPQYTGSQLTNWTPFANVLQQAKDTSVRAFTNQYGPKEDEPGPTISIVECTASYAQALRVYLKYKYSTNYPTSVNLP